MGRIRRGLQRVADRLARRVARDDLFEKPGERARTDPLPPRDQAPAQHRPPLGEPQVPVGQGESSCQLADLAQVRRALGPGSGPRVVNHWATWCAPCVQELPHLVRLADELAGAATLLGISWDLFDPRGGPEQVAAQVADFAAERGLTWPTLLATCEPAELFAAFDMASKKIPQTWVLDADGRILERFEGVVDAAQCARIVALIRES